MNNFKQMEEKNFKAFNYINELSKEISNNEAKIKE